MDIKTYQKEAPKTESLVEEIRFNREAFKNALGAYITLGTIFDMMKKSIFYGKELDLERIQQLTVATTRMLNQLNFEINDEISNETKFDKDEAKVNKRIFHGIIGIMTEGSELAECLEEALIHRKGEIDIINLWEELQDCNWYQAIIQDEAGLDWEEGFDRNIEKLQKKRYKKGKFTQEEAINRDTEAERQALEGK